MRSPQCSRIYTFNGADHLGWGGETDDHSHNHTFFPQTIDDINVFTLNVTYVKREGAEKKR